MYLKLIQTFLHFSRSLSKNSSVFEHPFPEIAGQRYSRTEYLLNLARGRRVLHFGFLDSPFLKTKFDSQSLLHLDLRDVTSYLFGIDIDEQSLNEYRTLTGDSDNAIFDIQTDDQSDFSLLYSNYDLVLFSEVLEHLKNPYGALVNLRRVCENNGAQLCVTVPNAMSIMGFHGAITGVERVHPDHYFYFSPHTLRKLLIAAGFQKIELAMYTGNWYSPGLTQHGVIALCEPCS